MIDFFYNLQKKNKNLILIFVTPHIDDLKNY